VHIFTELDELEPLDNYGGNERIKDFKNPNKKIIESF
jgi:hypothetical protein